MDWATHELRCGAMEDLRLDLRLLRIVEALNARPNCPPPEAFESRAALVGAYRFWRNPRVSPGAILKSHIERTAERAAQHPVVLAVQDTSELDLTAHPATRGLGYLASPCGRGLLLHSVMAVSPTGAPLGLLRQIVWSRPLKERGKRHRRRQRPLKDKESRRWLHGMAAAGAVLQGHPQVVVIGDREADFFPLFAASRPGNVDLLVRVSRHKRRVEHPAKYLDQALALAPVGGGIQIQIPRRSNRPARTAKLTVRWVSLDVHAPRHGPRAPAVRLQFILVEEIDPPKKQAAIRWILATTLPIRTLEDALQSIQWYAYRWRIEQFHETLKDGCRIEQLQLEEADQIRRALATYTLVACRLLWLTYQARETSNVPCTVVLEDYEWQALYARIHRSTKIPAKAPTLREAVRMIARLGGFLGRKSDGEPGPKTLWRGLRRLEDISQTWQLLTARTRDSPC